VIITAGGTISESFGKAHVFQAAAKGDVKALSTLYDFTDLKVDILYSYYILFRNKVTLLSFIENRKT
jgi:hypothetical protein